MFKTGGTGIELSRIKELPSSFYTGYASLDEFLSTASTSDNNQGHGKDKYTSNKTHYKKHFRPVHGDRMASKTQNTSTKHNVNPNSGVIKKSVFQPVNPSLISQTGKKRKHKGHAQDAIDEMNRQYDHNTCLDRFINDIEQNQKQQQQNSEENQQENVEHTCNNSPSNSSSNSSSSSSVRPNSNEDTDSLSRISESIKSSTPETGKNEKEENSGGSNSGGSNSGGSNSGGSSSKDRKENKQVSEKVLDNMLSLNATKMSAEVENIVGIQQQLSSLESGVGSAVTEDTPSTSSNQVESLTDKTKNYKGGKLGRKRKRGYIYNPKPVIEKPPKQFVPDTDKDQSYWDKRQRNNEAARRSREMRRLKEKETHDKLVRLKNENEALRVAITLLIQRNENLEFIINELDKTENGLTSKAPTVPVTC